MSAGSIGWTTIEVLPFLRGLAYDDLARSYVHALRPSEVRVSTGLLKSDAITWRVTVMVDDANTIAEITQEVEVALPSGVAHGHALDCELRKRLPQKWGRRPSKPDAKRVDENDYVRAGGGAICDRCGFCYYDHPTVPGYEWLNRACDGRLLKL